MNSTNLTHKIGSNSFNSYYNNFFQSTKQNNHNYNRLVTTTTSNSGIIVNHQQAFNNFVAGQQQSSNSSQDCISNNMPKNEPVKLVYPQTSSSTSTLVTMNNNRVTFTSAPVHNGTITLSPMTANSLQQPNQQQQATVMQARTAGGQQAPTLIFKNAVSSAPGTLITTPVTMTKANSQVGFENIFE